MTIYYLMVLILVIIDQFTKYLTVTNIAPGETIPFIEGIMSFTFVKNTGAAFSILEGQMWLFYIVTVIAIIVIVYFMQTEGKQSKLAAIGLSFLLAGAIGNFVDRLLHQYVVDMIQLDFMDFAIFNLADTWITIGVVIFITYLLFFDETDEKESVKHGR